jgi:hypothetical protein
LEKSPLDPKNFREKISLNFERFCSEQTERYAIWGPLPHKIVKEFVLHWNGGSKPPPYRVRRAHRTKG